MIRGGTEGNSGFKVQTRERVSSPALEKQSIWESRKYKGTTIESLSYNCSKQKYTG